jgi:hypothetical protein
MSPSTSTPQDAFKRPGWWTCYLCVPNVHERGGQSAFYTHYLATHWVEVKA